MMLPGESHEWQDNDGEGPFKESPKQNDKRTYRNLELEPPDIEIPEVGGGLCRLSNTLNL